METIFYIFIFVFGAIIGSFLNVVICRHGIGRSLGGRSKCAVTGKTLKWYELIPIVSFIIQGGRSRHSKTKLSWQYPLVEFFTGLIFFFIAYKFYPLVFGDPRGFIFNNIFYFSVFSLLICIFVYDYRHKIIPDGFLIPLSALSIVSIFFISFDHSLYFAVPPLWKILAGPVAALPLLMIWAATRGRGLGFGDVLLMIPLGFILGMSKSFATLMLAFWIGAVFGIFAMLFGKKNKKSEIPFAPFIIIGFTLSFLHNIDMYSIASFFQRIF